MLANFFLCLDRVTDTWTRAETQYKSVVTMLERPKSPNVVHPIKPTQHRRRPYSCRFFAHVLKHQVLFSFLTAAFGGRYHEDRHAHKLGPVFLASFSHVVCIHMDVFFAHRGRQLDRVPDAQNRIWSGACSSNEKWNNATKNTNEHHTTINDLNFTQSRLRIPISLTRRQKPPEASTVPRIRSQPPLSARLGGCGAPNLKAASAAGQQKRGASPDPSSGYLLGLRVHRSPPGPRALVRPLLSPRLVYHRSSSAALLGPAHRILPRRAGLYSMYVPACGSVHPAALPWSLLRRDLTVTATDSEKRRRLAVFQQQCGGAKPTLAYVYA